jgi:hypothetical protein
MWEAWHFTNRTHSGSLSEVLVRLAVSYPMCIVLSWLIGEAVERSRSILVAHTLHVWINLVLELSWIQAKVALAVSLGLWVWLLMKWRPAPWRPWPFRIKPTPPSASPAVVET